MHIDIWSWFYRDILPKTTEEKEIERFYKLESKPVIVNEYHQKYGVCI